MNDRVDVDAILDRFREWIESARAEDANEFASDVPLSPAPEAVREFGIIDLIEEFTALRHEVKLQTKSSRGLSEQVESVKGSLERAIEQFRSVEPREDQAAWTAGKALAAGLGGPRRGPRPRRARNRTGTPADRGSCSASARNRFARSPSQPVMGSPPAARGPTTVRLLKSSSVKHRRGVEPFRRVFRRLWFDSEAVAQGHGRRASRSDSLRRPHGRSRAHDCYRSGRLGRRSTRDGDKRAQARLYMAGPCVTLRRSASRAIGPGALRGERSRAG